MEKNVSGKVRMNYTNYERAIVERYGVELYNWPLPGTVKNPSKVGGRAHVQKLLDALKSHSCKWVSFSEDDLRDRMTENRERQARGEQVYVPRKARVRVSQHASKEMVDSDESSSSSSSDED
jgi:hypothetical protein